MKIANNFRRVCVFLCGLVCFTTASFADDGYDLWLKYTPITNTAKLHQYRQFLKYIVTGARTSTTNIAINELENALQAMLGVKIKSVGSVKKDGALVIGTPASSSIIKNLNYGTRLDSLGAEGYILAAEKINGKRTLALAANSDIGLLYGVFNLLRLIQTGADITNINITSKPKIQFRLLNHWDNLNGSVERGYAGKSLWNWNDLPGKLDPRYTDYARANASLGINGTVINNVNATPRILTAEYIEKVAALAKVFRPYGIKMFLSINFSSPLKPASGPNQRGGVGNLETSDPLDPQVRQWWKEKAHELYAAIPDFGGFLVKANSEGQPGPNDYGRTQVDGANMLAEALAPYNGIVMWRSFVYDAEVDPDRAKRAYLEFQPKDGLFMENVFVQSKNGPIDFQPREPVSPLFGAMPKTPLMLELQITQEYLGHSKHLVYLAPMWKEYLEFDTFANGKGSTLAGIVDGSVQHQHMTGIAGVTNIGNDRNWCGHLFAQANWYAFGRLAWDHSLPADQIADEWIPMTLSKDDQVIAAIKAMMLGSWEACINYMTPLGLHHIMQEGFHYGPQPDFANSREDWTSVYYHKADSIGIGYDRSSTGSAFTAQYLPPVRDLFDNIDTCPEKYLLWFHHTPWDHQMSSGRTLWHEMCFRYYAGVDYVYKMQRDWQSLEKRIDPEIFAHVQKKLQVQAQDAAIWRDTCINYFQKFSKRPVTEFK
ncbi:MAG TPA: alpha-glucuronidase family glycosyl hydrolase [bacterium]|nr:alpha-glucuronidase family glycosyl hydrolase [bacterium]HPN42111.1 alpha-glucuronidase family glycosyl hydrolase [bacterium]